MVAILKNSQKMNLSVFANKLFMYFVLFVIKYIFYG